MGLITFDFAHSIYRGMCTKVTLKRACFNNKLWNTVSQNNWILLTWFPRILENLENNKLIFQVLEMSWNFTKSGNVMEKYCLWKNPLKTKKPVNTYACRRKLPL